MKLKSHANGFTLLEVLLALAVIGVLGGISLPTYRTLQIKNDLDIALVTTAQSLRRSQVLSQAVDGDSNWGTKIQSGSIVIFKGVSYAARDTTYDEIFSLPQTITPSGTTEVVMDKLTGLPQTSGTLNLTTESDTKTLTINQEGMVSY